MGRMGSGNVVSWKLLNSAGLCHSERLWHIHCSHGTLLFCVQFSLLYHITPPLMVRTRTHSCAHWMCSVRVVLDDECFRQRANVECFFHRYFHTHLHTHTFTFRFAPSRTPWLRSETLAYLLFCCNLIYHFSFCHPWTPRLRQYVLNFSPAALCEVVAGHLNLVGQKWRLFPVLMAFSHSLSRVVGSAREGGARSRVISWSVCDTAVPVSEPRRKSAHSGLKSISCFLPVLNRAVEPNEQKFVKRTC